MELKDILDEIVAPPTFYGKVLEQIKKLSADRGLEFVAEAKEEWELKTFVQPRRRTFFGIEDKGKNRAILGMVLVPDPAREYSDLAWNRIEEPLRNKLSSFEKNGYEGTVFVCVLMQVWEADKRTILVPLKELERVKRYRDTGDFRIKRDGGQFFLETPKWEDNIKLKDRLEEYV